MIDQNLKGSLIIRIMQVKFVLHKTGLKYLETNWLFILTEARWQFGAPEHSKICITGFVKRISRVASFGVENRGKENRDFLYAMVFISLSFGIFQLLRKVVKRSTPWYKLGLR